MKNVANALVTVQAFQGLEANFMVYGLSFIVCPGFLAELESFNTLDRNWQYKQEVLAHTF